MSMGIKMNENLLKKDPSFFNIRVKISEHCGLSEIREIHPHGSEDCPGSGIWVHGRRDDPVLSCRALPLPDYLNDLNAMHGAEKVLNAQQQVYYIFRLKGIMGLHEARHWKHVEFDLAHATASQRALAFLEAINTP